MRASVPGPVVTRAMTSAVLEDGRLLVGRDVSLEQRLAGKADSHC